MEIKANSFAIDLNSAIPAMIIFFDMYYLDGEEAPLSISGRMLTDDLKVVSNLTENYIVQGISYNLNKKEPLSANNKEGIKNIKWGFHMTAPLSKDSVSHIELIREKDIDKSVNLNFDLVVKYFSTKNKLSPIPSPTFLTLKVTRLKSDLRIPQPTWLKTCAPYFEIGNFLLLELRIPDKISINEFWSDLYQALIRNVSEMQGYLRNGDWGNVLRTARRFFENIKIGDSKSGHKQFKEEFQKLMIADGHTIAGVDNLHDGIWQLFEFTSKYVHENDKEGNLKPIIVTAKEDAYFAFSICIGLLNLLGRKISK